MAMKLGMLSTIGVENGLTGPSTDYAPGYAMALPPVSPPHAPI